MLTVKVIVDQRKPDKRKFLEISNKEKSETAMVPKN